MDSRLVVEDTEIDGSSYTVGSAETQFHPMDVLWGQIRSLELRALARDDEARQLNYASDTIGIDSLERESRELRKQAQILRQQRSDSMTQALGDQIESRVLLQVARPNKR